jgi:predicted enzyme related to lactoylglutathione lyase
MLEEHAMPGSSLQLTQMTLATTHMPEMVRFYNTLFGVQLQPTEVYGSTLYRGTLAGIPLLLCPNEIAGVEAEQSRHQLAFRVADLSTLLELVETAGGSLESPITDSMTGAILRDPDGNTIEITRA